MKASSVKVWIAVGLSALIGVAMIGDRPALAQAAAGRRCPDLVVRQVRLFPSRDPQTGRPLLGVQVTVVNIGTAPSVPCRTALIRRPVPPGGIVAMWATPALAPGASVTHSTRLPLYVACHLTAYADYPAGADPYGLVHEFSGPAPAVAPPGESNNLNTVPYSGNPMAP